MDQVYLIPRYNSPGIFIASTSSPSTSWTFTQVSSDTFARANETPMLTPWDGYARGNGTGNANTFNLASGVAQVASFASDCELFLSTWASGNDQYIQGVVFCTGTSAGSGGGFTLRASANNDYRFVVDQSGNWELGKRLAGTFSSITTGTISFTSGSTVIRIGIKTSTIRLFADSVQFGGDITDTSLASGAPGLAYSSAVTDASNDNVSWGTIT